MKQKLKIANRALIPISNLNQKLIPVSQVMLVRYLQYTEKKKQNTAECLLINDTTLNSEILWTLKVVNISKFEV